MTDSARDLLLFSLGPVQSYITSARRTQDLWLGSEMLSRLAKVGLDAATASGAEAVFPVRVNGGWPESVPNRFMVTCAPGQAATVATAIESAVQGAWQRTADEVRTWLATRCQGSPWGDVWTRQGAIWLETYWAAWPWDGRPETYGAAYGDLNLLLDARKGVRAYPLEPEVGEKCTLCGQRDALHGASPSRGAIRDYWAEISKTIPSNLGPLVLRPDERLCAICSVKRFAPWVQSELAGKPLRGARRYPSTSSIASAPYRARLLEQWHELGQPALRHMEAVEKLRAYPGAPFASAEGIPFLKTRAEGKPDAQRLLYLEGDFFYRETLTPQNIVDALGRAPTDRDHERMASAAQSLGALLKASDKLRLPPPHKYLAILVMDGDHMGQLLSGCMNVAEHQAVSQALVSFAAEAHKIVSACHAGWVVYAGGDDVLALLPVEHALSAADALQQAFRTQPGLQNGTASVGIAIIHHGSPLAAGLRAAQRAEHAAKKTYHRNAIVVELHPRSGEVISVGSRWDVECLHPLVTFGQVRELISSDTLSDGIVHDVQGEWAALSGLEQDPGAITGEVRRLLTRHWQPPKATSDRAIINDLADRLGAIAKRIGMKELANWLLVARFMAKGDKG